MATLREILNQVLQESGFGVPSAYTTNSDPEQRKIVAMANRSAATLSRYDWQALRKSVWIDLTVDDLGNNTYALPTDFRFYRPDTAFKEDSIQWVDLPTSDPFWAYLKADNSPSGVVVKARFEAGLLYVHDPGGVSNRLRLEYISKHPVTSDAGTTQERFQTDDDIWLLDRNLIEMDIIWRWKKRLGMEDWNIDRQDFLSYENSLKGDDSGSKTLIDGSRPEITQSPSDSPQADLYA